MYYKLNQLILQLATTVKKGGERGDARGGFPAGCFRRSPSPPVAFGHREVGETVDGRAGVVDRGVLGVSSGVGGRAGVAPMRWNKVPPAPFPSQRCSLRRRCGAREAGLPPSRRGSVCGGDV